MGEGPFHRPLGWPLLIFLSVVLVALAPVLLEGVSFAFGKVGIGPQTALTLLVASLMGSWVNLPLRRLRGESAGTFHTVSAFGVRWRVQIARPQAGTLLALNLGGAVIPLGVSGWILAHDSRWWAALAAAAVVTAVTNRVARPVAGLGIAVPALVPPLAAAAAGALFAGSGAAPAAYVAGTLGTLIGADLMNLRRLSGLHTAVASIGGAGTFDGIFLSGVLGVILATVL